MVDFDQIDPQLKYLIADSDTELRDLIESSLPPEQDYRSTDRHGHWTPAERDQLDGRIFGRRCAWHRRFGSTESKSVHTRPMTNEELDSKYARPPWLLKRRTRAAIPLLSSSLSSTVRNRGQRKRTDSVSACWQQPERARDFISPEVRAFVKALRR